MKERVNELKEKLKGIRGNKLWLGVATVILALALLLFPIQVQVGTPADVSTPAYTIGQQGQGQVILTIGSEAWAAGGVDYTCDGIADNVQFQAALNALPARGGKLVVLAGKYDFSAAVSRAINNVTVQGVGKSSYIGRDGSNPCFDAGSQDNWVFRDIALDAGGADIASASNWTMQNIWIGATYYALRTDSNITASSLDIPVGRTATFVVAASDSLDSSKAQADYVCDGTADDVEIQEAIDALPSGGGKVLLLGGNYLLGDTITLDNNVTLAGVGWSTILKAKNSFGSKDVIKATSKSGVIVRDLAVDGNFANNARADANDDQNGIEFAGCSHCLAENCYVHDMPDNGIATSSGASEIAVINNRVEGCHWKGIMMWEALRGRVIGNHVDGCNIVVEYASADDNLIMGNVVENAGTSSADDNGIWIVAPCQRVTVVGNVVRDPAADCIRLTASSTNGMEAITIVGNILDNPVAAGVRLYNIGTADMENIAISSNTMTEVNYGIRIDTTTADKVFDVMINSNVISDSGLQFLTNDSKSVSFVNNIVHGNWAVYGLRGSGHRITGNTFDTTNGINGDKTLTVIKDNTGLEITDEQDLVKAKNTAGSELVAGDVVVLKAVAAGNEITTTTNQGDDKVLGMVAETIADNASGLVLVKGKTTALKVDGTTDIAIGDLLGTFTTAKIAMKAGSGDMAFAIALEAYTADDSNGVIDALLISPRKV